MKNQKLSIQIIKYMAENSIKYLMENFLEIIKKIYY